MATATDLRQRVRDNFYSRHPGERPFRQILGTGYTDVAATVAVPDGAKWAVGDVMENETTSEQLFITSIATNVLTVARGFSGTTAVAGVAGDVLNKNPRMSGQKIDDSVTALLLELETHGVYHRTTAAVTPLPNEYLYSVTLDGLVDPPGIIDVFYEDTSSGLPISLPYRQRLSLPTAISATQAAIELLASGMGSAVTAYVLFAKAYAAVTELPTRLEETVVLGASGRVLGSMIGQVLQDPGQHTNRTVQPGQASRDARWYQAEFLTAVRREAALLGAQYMGTGNIQSNRRKRWRP